MPGVHKRVLLIVNPQRVHERRPSTFDKYKAEMQENYMARFRQRIIIASVFMFLVLGKRTPAYAQQANGEHLTSSVPATIILGDSLDVFTSVKNTGTRGWTAWFLQYRLPSWSASWSTYGIDSKIDAVVLPGETSVTFKTLPSSYLPSEPGTYSFQVRALYEKTLNTYNWMSNTPFVVQFTVIAPPRFCNIKQTSGNITLSMTNLMTGGTNSVLRSPSLWEPIWTTAITFVASSPFTNWAEVDPATSAFYKLISNK
jgi:hypothetical protein